MFVIAREILNGFKRPIRTDYVKAIKRGGVLEITNNRNQAIKFPTRDIAQTAFDTNRISPDYEVKAFPTS